jgi:hypothetical protein
MRVKITKIFAENEEGIDVEFSTELGNCKGIWQGLKPIIGGIYEIEIEIPYALKWKHDIFLAQNKIFQIRINESNVSLIGILESNEGNFSSLKLGNDIVLLETEGIPFEEKKFIEILTEKLLIYDINI